MADLRYKWGEVKHYAVRTAAKLQGRVLRSGVRGVMGGSAMTMAVNMSHPMREVAGLTQAGTQATLGFGQALAASTGGLVSLGLATGMDVVMNQMDHKHRLNQLSTLYAPQLAALTGKNPRTVGPQELKMVANGRPEIGIDPNPSLQEELKRNNKKRLLKNIGAAVGTVAAFAVVTAAIAFMPAAILPMAGWASTVAAQGFFATTAGIKLGLAVGAIGFVGMKAASWVTEKVGKKITGLNKPSVEDKLDQLSKQIDDDLKVTPAQVMDIFLTAHPEIGTRIEEQYGRSYAKLNALERRQIADQYPETEVLANAINNRQMHVRELAFSAHGQHSGAYPNPLLKDRMKMEMQERLDPVQDKVLSAKQQFQEWRAERAERKNGAEETAGSQNVSRQTRPELGQWTRAENNRQQQALVGAGRPAGIS